MKIDEGIQSLMKSLRCINSASHYIKFFINNLFDYQAIRNNLSSFLKEIECFSLNHTIKEVLEIF